MRKERGSVVLEEIPELLEYMDEVMPKKTDENDIRTQVLDTVVDVGEYLIPTNTSKR